MLYPVFSALVAVLGLLVAVYFAVVVLKKDIGTPKMAEISKDIQEGGMAFIRREYSVIAFIIIGMVVLIIFWLGQPLTSISYFAGAIFSATAGFVGISIATRANARTAQGASQSLNKGLRIAFSSGAIMGMVVYIMKGNLFAQF